MDQEEHDGAEYRNKNKVMVGIYSKTAVDPSAGRKGRNKEQWSKEAEETIRMRWKDEKALREMLVTKDERIAKKFTKQLVYNGDELINRKDVIGDKKKWNGSGDIAVMSWNVNKGILYTHADVKSKEDVRLWSEKYEEVTRYAKKNKIDITMIQEAGLTSRRGVVENVARIHGYVAKVNARLREKGEVNRAGAGEGLMIQMTKNIDAHAPIYIEEEGGRIQVQVVLGAKPAPHQRQKGMAIFNVYIPAQEATTERKAERLMISEALTDMISKMKEKGYQILLMGDLNTAMRKEDRKGGTLTTDDKVISELITREWGLVNVWEMRERLWEEQNKGFTCEAKTGPDGEERVTSRIDHVFCDESLVPYIKGVMVDMNRRIATDHRPQIVTIAKEYWEQEKEVEWVTDELDYQTKSRLKMKGWGTEQIKEYQEIVKIKLEEYCKKDSNERVVFGAGKMKWLKGAGQAQEKWIQTTSEIGIAKQWSKSQEGTLKGNIYAVTLRELESQGIKWASLETEQQCKARRVKEPWSSRYTQNKIVALERPPINWKLLGTSSIEEELEEWRSKMDKREASSEVKTALNDKLDRLVRSVREAHAEVMLTEEDKTKVRPNTTPLWSTMVCELVKERQVLTALLRSIQRFKKTNDEDDFLGIMEHSTEWEVEWRIARGEIGANRMRERERMAVRSADGEAVLKWRRREKELGVKPVVRLKDVEECLTKEVSKQTKWNEWEKQIKERRQELVRATRIARRERMFERGEDDRKNQADFENGKMKNLVNKIVNKAKGVHTVDNVWLQHGSGLRLSCDMREVTKETERFFYEWMRSKAPAWGTAQELKNLEFPRIPAAHKDNPVYEEVSSLVKYVLQRPLRDPVRGLYDGVEDPITLPELQEFLGGVKKGTAPGITGIPVDMWRDGPEELRLELLDLLNVAFEAGEIPDMWSKRLIRALAKTDTAVGLADIRPITLLEVTQKILTGILTARISEVWNSTELIHTSQMAFLNGRGCHQALERTRGLLEACLTRNKEGNPSEPSELHILFLDLAKAYDSVEYWALEAAMRGLGVPEKVLTIMRTIDNEAEAKVLMGGAVKETGWIPLERGAPQGEVMSPLRFIAWMNILMEVMHMMDIKGYKVGEDETYLGQAFCDDGMFCAESNSELRTMCEVVSAFCDMFKVKINAGKSYYMVSRGEDENRKRTKAKRVEGQEQGTIRLWDYTAGIDGKWEQVWEIPADTEIRYLGVMVAADGTTRAQTQKVDRAVRRVIESVRTSRCSGSMANYIITACVGGILNYHAPFTRISNDLIGAWDREIRGVLRQKSGIWPAVRLGSLYGKRGEGLGWFSARQCVNECVLTEGWIMLTSNTVEGRMLRKQVGRVNRERGTVVNPFMCPQKLTGRKWPSMLQLTERVLCDIGWKMLTDVFTRNEEDMTEIMAKRAEDDFLLEEIEPEVTQQRFRGESTLLQDAGRHGVYWVSQLLDTDTGTLWEDEEIDRMEDWTDSEKIMRKRWMRVLGTERGTVKEEWRLGAGKGRKRENGDGEVNEWINAHRGGYEGPVRMLDPKRFPELWGGRDTEYKTQPGTPLIVNGQKVVVMASDGSLKDGQAGVSMQSVQNGYGHLRSRLTGSQRISKAELIGCWAQVRAVVPLLELSPEMEAYVFLDNKGIQQVAKKAERLSDREIKRSPDSGLYLREIREWKCLFPGRIHVEWIKGHTRRGGPLHDGHGAADLEAGLARDDPMRQQERFVAWDWDFILLDSMNQRIEGDVRRAVRKRMGVLWWEERGGREGETYSNLTGLDSKARRLMGNVLQASGQDWHKKEWIHGVRGRTGLREEWGDDKCCRLCGECKCEDECDGEACRESLSHILRNRCTPEMERVIVENERELYDLVAKGISVAHREQIQWLKEGEECVKDMEGLRVVEWKEEREVNTRDPWQEGIPDTETGGANKWDGEPFTMETNHGRGVDIRSVLKSHEDGQYPRACGVVARRWLTIRSEQTEVTVSGATAVVLPRIAKIVRDSGRWSGDGEAAKCVELMRTVRPRQGPMSVSLSEALLDLTEFTAHPTVLWNAGVWGKKVEGRSRALSNEWMEVGYEEFQSELVNRIEVRWEALDERGMIALGDEVCSKGLDAFNVMVLPKGTMRNWEHGRVTWDADPPMGGWAWTRIGETPAVEYTKGKMVQGEVWFIGGHQGWLQLDWERVNRKSYAGIRWCTKGNIDGGRDATEEWSRAVCREMWGLQSGPIGIGWSPNEILRLKGSDRVARCLGRAGCDGKMVDKMLLEAKYSVDRIKNAFKQEVYQAREVQESEVMTQTRPVRRVGWVVKGLDKTRSPVRVTVLSPAKTIKHVKKSRKFRNTDLADIQAARTKDSVLGMPERGRSTRRGISKRYERRAVQWVHFLSSLAYVKAAEGGSEEGLDPMVLPYFEYRANDGYMEHECFICEAQARTKVCGAVMCPKCYASTPKPEDGYILEGLMYLAEIAKGVQGWGTQQVREALTSVGAAQRWREWYIQNRWDSDTSTLVKWYEAMGHVSGKRILLSEVEEVWEEAGNDLRVALSEYFPRKTAGVDKGDSERRVLFRIGEEWGGYVETVRAAKVTEAKERMARKTAERAERERAVAERKAANIRRRALKEKEKQARREAVQTRREEKRRIKREKAEALEQERKRKREQREEECERRRGQREEAKRRAKWVEDAEGLGLLRGRTGREETIGPDTGTKVRRPEASVHRLAGKGRGSGVSVTAPKERVPERMPTLTDRKGAKKVVKAQVGDGWVRAVAGGGRSRAAWRARCGEWTEVDRLRGTVSGRVISAAVASKQIEWRKEQPKAGTSKGSGVGVENERNPNNAEEQSRSSSVTVVVQVNNVVRPRRRPFAQQGTPTRRAIARPGLQVPPATKAAGGVKCSPPRIEKGCRRSTRLGAGQRDVVENFLRTKYG